MRKETAVELALRLCAENRARTEANGVRRVAAQRDEPNVLLRSTGFHDACEGHDTKALWAVYDSDKYDAKLSGARERLRAVVKDALASVRTESGPVRSLLNRRYDDHAAPDGFKSDLSPKTIDNYVRTVYVIIRYALAVSEGAVSIAKLRPSQATYPNRDTESNRNADSEVQDSEVTPNNEDLMGETATQEHPQDNED